MPGNPPLHRVVEDDAQRMTVARPDATDAVSEIDPVHPAGPLHWPMMHGKDHGVSLPER